MDGSLTGAGIARRWGPLSPLRRASLIALVCLCLSPRLGFADKTYIVKKNDTVSGIARAHGISSSQLVKANNLRRPDRIIIGQRLRIPEPLTSLAAAFDPALRKTMTGTAVRSGRWKYIVIHHSGTSMGTMKGMDRYHREERHMENGLAYHFVIGNGNGMKDGEIEAGARWTDQLDGGHLASEALNKKSVGICLVGNFDETAPTRKQMESLKALTRYLLVRCGLKASVVQTHQEINPISTRCPGKKFPTQTFLRELEK